MTVSVVEVTSAAQRIINGATNFVLTFSAGSDHDTYVYLWLDRTGGAVINTLSDTNGGSLAGGQWVSRSASGTSHIFYVAEDVATSGGLVATLVTNVSQNGQIVGVRLRSDAGGSVYPTVDAVATIATGTAVTQATSNSVTATAAGVVVGLLSCSNAQGTTPTSGGSETFLPVGAAGARLYASYTSHGSAGSYSHSTGVAGLASTNFAYHLVAFKESGGAAAYTPRSMLLGVG